MRLTSEHYFVKGRLLEVIVRHRDKLNGSLLDFGCGSRPYESFIRCREYIGVDQKDYDGHHLLFGDMSFDSILSTEVFEHVFNLPEILKELHRVLVPGGTMLITCPFAFPEHEMPNDFARYTSSGIGLLLKEAGFKILVQEKAGNAWEAIATLLVNFNPRKRSFIKWVIFRCFVFAVNLLALLISKASPDGHRRLYLNNVIICQK